VAKSYLIPWGFVRRVKLGRCQPGSLRRASRWVGQDSCRCNARPSPRHIQRRVAARWPVAPRRWVRRFSWPTRRRCRRIGRVRTATARHASLYQGSRHRGCPACSVRVDNWNRSTAIHSNIGSPFQEQERNVRRDFWSALKHFAGRLPFAEELVAAYYCALDPATPMRVREILLAALAYFIVRWRYRPLTWLWRLPGLGFTDDRLWI
jgi:uncharacterized membrane protein YkvA (DUF1232 family)